MFCVYAVQSLINSRVYIGQTQDLNKRVGAYNAGLVKCTRRDRPWRLLKSQACETREAARWLEYCIKSSRGKRLKWLKN